MRLVFTLTYIFTIYFSSYSQSLIDSKNEILVQSYSYAYITVQGKTFGKKLHVNVDLGDTPEQIKAGKEYSEILTNKKSYAAILNYMAEQNFELVESRDISFSYQGTGGTAGIIFIMRKKLGSVNNK